MRKIIQKFFRKPVEENRPAQFPAGTRGRVCPPMEPGTVTVTDEKGHDATGRVSVSISARKWDAAAGRWVDLGEIARS